MRKKDRKRKITGFAIEKNRSSFFLKNRAWQEIGKVGGRKKKRSQNDAESCVPSQKKWGKPSATMAAGLCEKSTKSSDIKRVDSKGNAARFLRRSLKA